MVSNPGAGGRREMEGAGALVVGRGPASAAVAAAWTRVEEEEEGAEDGPAPLGDGDAAALVWL